MQDETPATDDASGGGQGSGGSGAGREPARTTFVESLVGPAQPTKPKAVLAVVFALLAALYFFGPGEQEAQLLAGASLVGLAIMFGAEFAGRHGRLVVVLRILGGVLALVATALIWL